MKLLSIDFGFSATKAILVENKKIITPYTLPANESQDIHLRLDQTLQYFNNEQYKQIIVTGGKSYLLSDSKFIKVNELEAACKGALTLAKAYSGIVVNCGTGASITHFDGKSVTHQGGTGIAGGTLKGLSKLILNIGDIPQLESLALKGNLENIDVSIKDIVGKPIGILPENMTAANFAKLENYSKEDIALGLINLVASSIASNSIQVARKLQVKTIYLSGGLIKSKIIFKQIEKVGRILGFEFIPVPHPEYATCYGASLDA